MCAQPPPPSSNACPTGRAARARHTCTAPAPPHACAPHTALMRPLHRTGAPGCQAHAQPLARPHAPPRQGTVCASMLPLPARTARSTISIHSSLVWYRPGTRSTSLLVSSTSPGRSIWVAASLHRTRKQQCAARVCARVCACLCMCVRAHKMGAYLHHTSKQQRARGVGVVGGQVCNCGGRNAKQDPCRGLFGGGLLCAAKDMQQIKHPFMAS